MSASNRNQAFVSDVTFPKHQRVMHLYGDVYAIRRGLLVELGHEHDDMAREILRSIDDAEKEDTT